MLQSENGIITKLVHNACCVFLLLDLCNYVKEKATIKKIVMVVTWTTAYTYKLLQEYDVIDNQKNLQQFAMNL